MSLPAITANSGSSSQVLLPEGQATTSPNLDQALLKLSPLLAHIQNASEDEAKTIYKLLIPHLPMIPEEKLATFLEPINTLLQRFPNLRGEQIDLCLAFGKRYVNNASSLPTGFNYFSKAVRLAKAANDETRYETALKESNHYFLKLLSSELIDILENKRKCDDDLSFKLTLESVSHLFHFCFDERDKEVVETIYSAASGLLLPLNSNKLPKEFEKLKSIPKEKIDQLKSHPFASSNILEALRQHLDKYREFFQQLPTQNSVDQIRQFQKDLFVEFRDEFFSFLLVEIFQILGPEPCQYNFLALGSTAKQEMRPYSDLEWLILIEDEKHKSYFESTMRILNLIVISLGETKIKVGATFPLHTNDGFHLEISNDDHLSTHIGLPKRIASQIAELPNDTSKNIFLNATSLSPPLPSRLALFQTFQEEVKKQLNLVPPTLGISARDQGVYKILKERHACYLQAWKSEGNNRPPIDIKRDFIQLLLYAINDLAIFSESDLTNTLDIIRSSKKFTPSTQRLLEWAVAELYRISVQADINPSFLTNSQTAVTLSLIQSTVLLPLYQIINRINTPKAIPIIIGERKTAKSYWMILREHNNKKSETNVSDLISENISLCQREHQEGKKVKSHLRSIAGVLTLLNTSPYDQMEYFPDTQSDPLWHKYLKVIKNDYPKSMGNSSEKFFTLIVENVDKNPNDACVYLSALFFSLQVETLSNDKIVKIYEICTILIPHFVATMNWIKDLQSFLEETPSYHECQYKLALHIAEYFRSKVENGEIEEVFRTMSYYGMAITQAKLANAEPPHTAASSFLFRVIRDIFLENVRGGSRWDESYMKSIILRIQKLKLRKFAPTSQDFLSLCRDVIQFLTQNSYCVAHLATLTGLLKESSDDPIHGNLYTYSPITERYFENFLRLQNKFSKPDKMFSLWKEFITSLLEDCFEIIGPPPCGYDIRAVNQFGLQEPCPFSSIECVILIEKEECQPYFEQLTRLFTCQIGLLIGTKNFISGKIPTYDYRSINSVILKPQIIVYPKKGIINPLKINQFLPSTSLHSNDPTIFSKYTQFVNEYLDGKENGLIRRQHIARNSIKNCLGSFKQWWSKPFDIYRKLNLRYQCSDLLHTLMQYLALYYGLPQEKSAAIVDKLTENKVLLAESKPVLQQALDTVYRIRIRLHKESGYENELAAIPEKKSKYLLLSSEEYQSLKKIHSGVLVPLYSAVEIALSDKSKIFSNSFKEIKLS